MATFHVATPTGAPLDTLGWTGATRLLGAQLVDSTGVATAVVATWIARDTTVVRVSQDGVVTAQANGATWVIGITTVQAANPADSVRVAVRRRAARIEVRDAPGGTVLAGPSATLAVPVTQTRHLAAAVLDSGNVSLSAVPVSWQSSRPDIATVDATGIVTALAPGVAAITASTAMSAGTVAQSVTVSTATRALTVDTDTIDVGVGQLTTGVLTPGPSVTPEALGGDETVPLSLVASDTGVVAVPAQVNVSQGATGLHAPLIFAGRRPGLARVTITAPGFTPATTVVRVTAPRIQFGLIGGASDPTVHTVVGAWPILNFTTDDGRGHPHRVAAALPFTITSSDTTVIVPINSVTTGVIPQGEVIASPQVIARAPGQAWIRVTAPAYAAESVAVYVAATGAPSQLLISSSLGGAGTWLAGGRQYFAPQSLGVASSVPSTLAPIPDVLVTFTQRHPDVVQLPASVPLRPDLTTGLRVFAWSGLALGADTVVASAPGFLPATFVLRVTTPQLVVQGAPTTGRVTGPGTFSVIVADSTGGQHFPLDGPVPLTATTSDATVLQVLDPVVVGTGTIGAAGIHVRFLDVGAATVTLRDPAGRYAPVTFRVQVVSTPMVVSPGGDTPGSGGTSRATLGMTQRLDGGFRVTVIPSGGSAYDTDLHLRVTDARLVQAQLLPVETNVYGQRSVALVGGDTTGTAWVVFTAAGLQSDSLRVDVGRGGIGVGPFTLPAGRSTFVAGDTIAVALSILDPVGRVRRTDQAISMQLTSTDTTIAVPLAEPVAVAAGQSGTTARVRLRAPGSVVLRARDVRSTYARAADGVSTQITVVPPAP